jgi:hypothetical protein
MIIYDRKSKESNRRGHAMMKELITEGAKLGIGEYRTHLAFRDQVMNTYNFNNGALLKFHDQLKDSLDPNGILSLGRNGIWGNRWKGKVLDSPTLKI